MHAHAYCMHMHTRSMHTHTFDLCTQALCIHKHTLIRALLLLFPCFICVICFCPKLVSALKSICLHALLCLFVSSMLVRILIF